jgi:anti-sigma-K factor RskA
MTHEAEQLLGAYSLGALDPDEHGQLEAHLATCSTCQAQLEEYRSIAAGLLEFPPASQPAKRVRQNLERSVSPPKPRTLQIGFGRLAIGAGALALVVLNALLLAEVRELGAREQRLLRQQQIALTSAAIGSYPDSEIAYVEADEVRGTLVYDAELPVAVMYLWGLERLDADRVYQVWLIRADGTRVSGGLMESAREGYFSSLLVHSPDPLSSYTGFDVTIEPSGGSDRPTGEQVIAGDLP